MGIEFFSRKPARLAEEAPLPLELEDFLDRPQIYEALRRMPEEIRNRQMSIVDEMNDGDALTHLQTFTERREDAKRDFHINDKVIETIFKGHEKEIQTALETEVFNNAENALGAGQTAKVKSFMYEGQSGNQPMAVKYLITPGPRTLDVVEEHNLLSEVDQLERIEKAEAKAGTTELIKVPHPYFYYRHGSIQCYGMEQIDGINLLQFRDGKCSSELKEDLKKSLASVDRAKLMDAVEHFFTAMHTVCLHGDIFINRPGNIMVSRTGTFYVIDFGESTAASSIDEQFADMYVEHKTKEVNAAKVEIGKFLDSLYSDQG